MLGRKGRDDRFDAAASIVQMGVCEAICVPMRGRYDLVGVIYIDTSTSPEEVLRHGGANKFSGDHLKLMIAIAHQAALAIEDTRYYSAMVQAERLAAIGQTVAILSHHIKNILQGIRGGSYLIELGLKDHDETIVGKGWKIVEKNQNKISALVMDMLTFSKEREPDLQTANINQVISDVVELMQTPADEATVALAWEPGKPMPDLYFDPEGLHRAVLNVVTNAIDAAAENAMRENLTEENRTDAKATEARVTITSRYLAKQNMVRIVVEDNGPGIPPNQHDELFSPFVSTKKGRGTGLGLPVSQKILNEHGGCIVATNVPGGGARFQLDLPAVAPPTTSPTTAR